MKQLQGKSALITGASRGIGLAIAKRFVAEGANVALCASRLGAHGKLPGTLEGAVEELSAGGAKVVALVCDLSDPEARADLVARAEQALGPLSILVNNAAGAKMGLPSKVTAAQRTWMYELNLNAPIDLAQQALAGMRARGEGWILNISSSTCEQPQVPYRDSAMAAHAIAAYGATKAALNRYTLGLAHEVAGEGVYVNTLAPESIVLTPGAAHVRDIAERNPDMAEPLEVMAEAALQLCSGQLLGQVAYSRRLLHSLGAKVYSLDGQRVLGDAFLAAQLDEQTGGE
ncbi:SDR family NAD(P)-dependent oxidoreductase [Parahaliea sp. F7430]|uniref:SDR family NAD(P)-dependent oxidoreductase n=1 Tax=Sediminihaliea albiluteola TaxID=2758564 RepID=A0A7W2YJC5_9GAMM|nr:SDR family NAD(P)-dependent oxidoreductase [Sediminihaliea albiluteola]MBA6413421.1 SDR family NAD(P)-dependent oxidoreductase [Sediminihaliea albiluteola]